jgi:hypothetical protein
MKPALFCLDAAIRLRVAADLIDAVARDRVEHAVVLADGRRAADVEVRMRGAHASISCGRSRRTWPPWPKNTGTTVIRAHPAATCAATAASSDGVISSRNASDT